MWHIAVWFALLETLQFKQLFDLPQLSLLETFNKRAEVSSPDFLVYSITTQTCHPQVDQTTLTQAIQRGLPRASNFLLVSESMNDTGRVLFSL